MRRKFLASILAFCMVLTLFPMTAFAAAPENAKEIKTTGTWTDKVYSVTLDETNDVDAIKELEKLSTGTSKVLDSAGEIATNPTVKYDSATKKLTVTFSDAALTAEGTYYIAITASDETTNVKVTVPAYTAPTATVVMGTIGANGLDFEAASVPVKVTINAGNAALTGNISVTGTAVNGQKSVTLKGTGTYVESGTAVDVNLVPQESGKLDTAGDWTLTITEVKVGNVTISGDKVTATNLTFKIAAEETEKGTQTLAFATTGPIEKTFGDATFTNAATVTEANGGAVSYASSNTSVATVNASTGAVTIVGVGEAVITATASATDDYSEATATYTLKVAKKTISVKSATVADKEYDGTTTGTVTAVEFNGATLANSAYTATAVFANANVATEVTATVTVTLAGDAAKNYDLSTNNTATAKASITAKAITGTVKVTAGGSGGDTITTDSVLTATVTSDVDTSKDTLVYKWYRGETLISGATANTYTVTADDTTANSVIKVEVTAGDNYSGKLTSNSITVGKKIMTATLTLSVNTEGSSPVLTAAVTDSGAVEYAGLAEKGLALVWTRDGTEFTNNAATYTVQASDRGKAITAKLVPATTSDYTGEVAATGAGTNLVNGVYTYPAVAPSAPTGLTATAGDASVVLRWTAPADNGGAEITGYKITVTDGETPTTVTTGNVTTYTVSDLTNDTEYTFTVKAVNSVGDGVASSEVTATPKAGTTSGGGSGGSGGGTPTEPTDPVDPNPPSTGEDVTQTVTPDVSDGTASATVDKETADKIVSDAVDNKSENVTVKVDVPAGSDVNEVKADIPASAVADLASKTDAALTVDTPVANVTIPNETLSQLGGASGNVTVTAAVNEDNSVKVEVQANGSTVGSLNGGMKVDLPVSQPTAGTVAVLVDENGNETILPKSSLDGSEMAVLLETGSATIKFVDNAQSFADTDNHWAKNSIAFVSSRNLFQGMENNNFKADVPMNRAMLVTVLHRLESTPDAAGSSFEDVPSDSYYATAAAWAAGKGIVTGDASGFSGDRSVTREEMAVMLYRYVQTINGNKGTLGSFSGMGGASDVSSWANQAMRWAVGSGIISGDNSGNLNPGSTATRGEVSQMLMNFVKLITK